MASAAASNANRSTRATAEALADDLYATHHLRLQRIAERNTYSCEDAEDALQDAFLLFINHFDPGGEAPPLAWLTLTLKRRCWALNRRRQTRLEHERPNVAVERYCPTADPQPEAHIQAADTVAQLRSQLAQLKPDERQALGLSILGYSYQEIAKLHDWTYTKVNRCIREGRAAMRLAQEKEPP